MRKVFDVRADPDCEVIGPICVNYNLIEVNLGQCWPIKESWAAPSPKRKPVWSHRELLWSTSQVCSLLRVVLKESCTSLVFCLSYKATFYLYTLKKVWSKSFCFILWALLKNYHQKAPIHMLLKWVKYSCKCRKELITTSRWYLLWFVLISVVAERKF